MYAMDTGTYLLLTATPPPAPPPAEAYSPLVFEVELVGFLEAALGVPVWAGVIPQGRPLPALVYTLVSSESELDLGGPAGICEWSVQFDAYASTVLGAATLIERLRSKLQGYSGPMGGAEVLDAVRESDSHGLDQAPGGSAQSVKRRTAEYAIKFREPIPVF